MTIPCRSVDSLLTFWTAFVGRAKIDKVTGNIVSKIFFFIKHLYKSNSACTHTVDLIIIIHSNWYSEQQLVAIFVFSLPIKLVPKKPKHHVLYAFTFTFMHLADSFIQSDLHCIQVTVLHFYQLLLSLGIEPMILALLTPCSTIWATGKYAYCIPYVYNPDTCVKMKWN